MATLTGISNQLRTIKDALIRLIWFSEQPTIVSITEEEEGSVYGYKVIKFWPSSNKFTSHTYDKNGIEVVFN